MNAGSRSVLAPSDVILFTSLPGAAVITSAGEGSGRLEDLVVKMGDGAYPRVTGAKVRVDDRDVFVDLETFEQLEAGELRLRSQTLSQQPFERRAGEVLLKEDILGRHLVDVVAGRIIRATDLALAMIDARWHLVGVQRRSRSGLGRLFRPQGKPRREAVQIIDWKDVQPFVAHVPTAKLFMPLPRLNRLHPARIADLVERATHEEGEEIMQAVHADQELAADVFEELDTTHQLEFVRSKSNEDVATLLARMEPDDAADLLLELEQDRRMQVFDLLPAHHKDRLRSLLMYHPTTAGGMMHPDLIAVPKGTTVATALDQVKNRPKALPHLRATLFLTEPDGRFLGSLFTADLLNADGGRPVESLESLLTVSLEVSADLAEVSLVMADFNLVALAVTDPEGKLVGAITADDLVEALVPDDWRRREEASAGE
ncbi:MAG TPA: CBS domain-containing protein [Candidatus Limnocylindrales bacterium]|nr:CBS domain-containing protein [Candidatus Limnocylindrales bacterium]